MDLFRENTVNRQLILVLCFCMHLFLHNSSVLVSEALAQPLVAVVKTKENAAYQPLLTNFSNYFTERNIPVSIEEYLLRDKNDLQRIQSASPALLLTLGTRASKIIANNIQNIPQVFAAVLFPENKLPRIEELSGVSLDIPPVIYLQKIQIIFPSIKNIGIIYDPEQNNKNVEKISIAAQGFNITIKTFPVNSAKEVPKIDTMDIDLLWLIPDTVVCRVAIVKHLLINSLQEDMPVIGISPSYVKAGAIMALICDYAEQGRQSAEIAHKLLNGEKAPLKTVPQGVHMYLNVAVADKIGVVISNQTLKEAYKVFGK